MSNLQVDSFLFAFEPTVAAEPYETWQHYKRVWNLRRGQKAMDVVAIESSADTAIAWLIEAKDFRKITKNPKPCHIAGLAQTVANKTAHTLAGLADASLKASLASEKDHARLALAATAKRIVLHLEPHTGPHTALFPSGFAANVLQQLRQLVRATDTNPLVLNIANTAATGVPWTVS